MTISLCAAGAIRWTQLALLVCVATIALGTSPAHSQQPSPSDGLKSDPQKEQTKGAQGKAATDSRGTPQSPLAVNVLPSTDADKEAAQKEADRQDKSASDWWLVRANWAIFLAMVAQLVVFGIQAQRLKETISEMKLATKTSERLVAVAADTAERQLRAYLYVNSFSIDVFEFGHPIKMHFPVINCGQTPARRVINRGWTGVRPYPLPDEWRFVITGQPVVSEVVCAPGPTDNGGNGVSEEVLTPGLFDRIKADKERLYVYALVTYFDVFGKKIRTTEACACTGGPEFAAAIAEALSASHGQKTNAAIRWEYTKHQNRAD